MNNTPPSSPPPILGKVIRVRGGVLEGYAYLPTNPALRVSLALMVDGELVATHRATYPYSGIGDGYHGFVIALPAPFYDGKAHRVEVQAEGRDTPLIGCPITATFSLPVPSVPPAPIVPPLLQGVIEGVRHGVVQGWCVNLNDMEEMLELQLAIDGQHVTLSAPKKKAKRSSLQEAQGITRFARPDLTQYGNAEYGFRIPIPEAWLDNAPHSLTITATSKMTHATPYFITHQTVLREVKDVYDGRVDMAEHPRVQGWIWNQRNAEEVVEVELYLDGALQGEMRADIMRADLVKAGIGDGAKAFTFILPSTLDPSKEYSVEVRCKATGEKLRGCPLSLSFSQTATTYHPYVMVKHAGEEAFTPASAIDVARTTWQLHALEHAPPIAVIIPIYNAYEEVQRCVQAVLEYSAPASMIILINDASPDPRIKEWLDRLVDYFPASKERLYILHNPQNLGYTATVNKAMAYAGEHDVVLLNSDTRVTPQWLAQLHATAYSAAHIGTVTAISNNAGAFSVPELDYNLTPEGLQDAEIGRLIRQNALRIVPSSPTGNGFCFYIKRALLQEIGNFDVQRFPRGYGEENDFSMRAASKGWVHKVDDACFVFHERSSSFGSEKIALIAHAGEILRRYYPDYAKRAADFCMSPAMQQVRRHVRELFSREEVVVKPRLLFVMHGKATGGTPATNRDLMGALADKYACWLVECDRQTITLQHFMEGELVEVAQWQLQSRLSLTDNFREDYAAIMLHILQHYAIELLHIRHLHKHSFDLPRIARALNIPVVLSFHDFYFICPTINLLDEKQRFCGGVCTKSIPKEGQDCALPYLLEETIPPLKHKFVHRWQEEVARIFPYVDGYVTTSHFAKEMLVRTYPALAQADFRVIEHGRDFTEQHHLSRLPEPDAPLKIVIAGQMARHKGAEFIEKLVELDKGYGKLEFHFLGNLPDAFAHLGTFHGSYQREELPEKVAAIGGHVMGIFSVWPETYCHVLSEAWACGMPVVASNLGALKERITTHGGGWVVDIGKPKLAYTTLCAIRENPHDYQQKAVKASLQAVRSVQEMAADYQALYGKIIK